MSHHPGRRPGHPSRRGIALGVAVSVGVGSAVLLSGAAPADAATVRAQSVGRFVDGAAGGNPIESIANVKDARATNPGTVTDQNPLDVTVGGQLNLPLSGALQLPGSGNAISLGAANQVAKAQSNGYSYGASGAVANSGGVSVGGNNGAYPAGATLNLSPAAIPTPGGLPSLPGTGSLAALGGVTASIGAVSALASTPAGYGKSAHTAYNIAGLKLTIASPALGGLLKTLGSALTVPSLPAVPAGLPALPASCSFKTQVLSDVSIAGGAVVISADDGSITVDVAALLRTLGLNLNSLPANTDLLADVLNYLASSKGLAAGLQSIATGTLADQKANFVTCADALTKAFPGPLNSLNTVVQDIFGAIDKGQAQLTDLIDQITKQVSGAAGANPFAPLTDGLKSALQIGVNVQPTGAQGSYRSPLKATPDQATGVVSGQTVVRAIEIDLGGGQVSLALANAAAGPSAAPAAVAPTPTSTPPPTHTPQRATPNAALPTGIPAGQGERNTSAAELPLVLLAIAVLMGGAGTVAWRTRRIH